MTPQDIRDMTEQDETHPKERYGEITLPVLGETVELVVLEADPDAPMPASAAVKMNDFLAVGPDRLPELANALAEACRGTAIDYLDGVKYASTKMSQSELNKVNWLYYGLNADGTPPAGWVDPQWLSHVTLNIDAQEHRTTLAAHFIVPWGEEHGADIALGADGLLSGKVV